MKKSKLPLSAILLFPAVMVFLILYSGCSTSEKAVSMKHAFVIIGTDESCIADGVLDESFWEKAEALNGFRIDADPDRIPEASTIVKIACSDKALMAAFTCVEPRIGLFTDGSGEAPENDYCELLTFSRPETPFYSPYLQRLDYKNANNAIRTQRRFKVDVSNKRVDSNIYKTGAHTPYITDDDWEGQWESAVSKDKRGYTVEMSIPWETIGGKPEPGHTFKLHFIRRRNVSGQEFASFNWAKNENLHIYTLDPADFTQEHPQIFAPVVFENGHAVINRYLETEPPWKIKRSTTEYESLLSNETEPLRSAHFYLGIRGFLLPDSIRSRYDDAFWAQEEMNFLTELGRAGATGPFLPGIMNSLGESGIDSLYSEYGMKFSYHSYGNDKKAREAGASFIRPRGTVAFFDPAYVKVKTEIMIDWLGKYGKKPWVFDIRGQDEPFNQIATLLQPRVYEMVDHEIRSQYGVGLGVPVGIPNMPYQDQRVHENSRAIPDHETSLSRIAMFRWLNKRFYEAAKLDYIVVRKYAPGIPYQPYNRNAVADMDFLDQALMHDISDYYSADPYPSFCIYVYGTARSRYHVGFTSKFVTDLAAGKPTQMIIQGCDMIQRYSTPENVREWTSQAAKTGAVMLDWWGNPRLDHPELYREMLRLSKLWTGLPKLKIPESPEIGVIFSDDSRVAAGDEPLNAHYTLHVILGEKLGACYDIISENHVRRGLHSFEGKKLLIAPQLSYVSREFSEKLMAHVKAGATLVVLDPDAFRHDIETGKLEGFRMDFLGLGKCPKKSGTSMGATETSLKRFSGADKLPLRPYGIVSASLNARTIGIPKEAEILYRYPDGEASAFSRKVGSGEVIVFGAMPFLDSELAIRDSGWDELFKALIDELGIERDMPIWDFMFPETGGEVETFDLLQ